MGLIHKVASLNGFLGVDKPAGWTSQNVVGWVRSHFRQKKVGHTGTLDPMATGVIVLCLGAYTRLSSFVVSSKKQYRAVIRFGNTTDTLDADGQVTARNNDVPTDCGEISAVLKGFVGPIKQIPPMYSAVQIEGHRLYKLARKGVEVERPPRQVEIFNIEVIAYRQPLLHVNVICSKGTYIRSLADDIGQKIGCGAHLVTLRRISVGPIELESCVSIQDLRTIEASGQLNDVILDPHTVLADLPEISLTAEEQVPFSHGNSLTMGPENLAGAVRVLDLHGSLLGIGQMEAGVLKPQRVIQNQ